MTIVPVSVVIAVRNGARFIGEALQSVVDQTKPPAEIIVVDDGSTDGTEAVVRRFPEVRHVRQSPSGAPAARNHGVRIAAMPFLAFLDADDLWHPTKNEHQHDRLARDDQLDYASGSVVQFSGPASAALASGSPPAPGRLLGMMTIRRESFLRVGPFSSQWQAGDMIDWWDRASAAGLRGVSLPSVALLRRIHDRNMGRSGNAPMRDYLRQLHSILERRRRP